jgi:hypothetical protein
MASEAEIAVWAITPNGAALASKISAGIPKAEVYVAQKIAAPAEVRRFESLAQAASAPYACPRISATASICPMLR